MSKKLLIIDGQNLLFQMLHMPNKIEGKDGRSVEGIWGFTGALLKIIKKVEPTHILVIFDGEQNHQKKEDQSKDPFSILTDIKAVLEELQIHYFETTKENKIDSYIKEYCQKYQEQCDIVISSFDYNLISLVSEHISLLTYRGSSSTLYTPEKVKSKWKIEPKYFADYKALVGDDSDNIAGIPRIGPKMAASLIQEFGHVEDILKNIEQISKDNVRLTLDIFQKDLMANIELLRLKKTGEIPIDLEELKWNQVDRKTKEILTKLTII